MQKTKAALTSCAAAFLLASCGSIFPDKLFYPVDSAPPKKMEQKAEAPTPAPAPAAERPKQTAQAEERSAPQEEGDAVMFGDAATVKGASPAAKPAETAPVPNSSGVQTPVPEKPEQRANPLAMIMPALDEKTLPPTPVEARESPLGINALTRTFGLPYDAAWEKTIEVMLSAPLSVIDKSSGIIVTEWMVQQRAGGGMGIAIFGDGQRVVRFKYAVKLYNRGGETEVTVIPYTQFSDNRQWLDGKPRRMISENLMRLIVAKLEGR